MKPSMEMKKKIISEAVKLNNQRQLAQKDFIKRIITLGTGFLVVFIGLKSDNLQTLETKWMFLIIISLLILGIILLTISLYYEIFRLDKHQTFLKEVMNEIINGGPISDRFNVVKKPLIFKFCECLGFSCFISSGFVLVRYLYLLEFSI